MSFQAKKTADLESEWADFEKMITGGGGDEEEKEPSAGIPNKSASGSPEQLSSAAAAVHNPYAYLSQYTSMTSTAGNEQGRL